MTLSRLPSRCKFCRVKFTPEERERGLRLHADCIGPFAESTASRIERKRVAKAKQLKALDAKQTRERKAAIKTIPDLIKEAQREFNSYCRERDRLAGFPCISSGRRLDWSGNGVDAGHYRSVGAAPHLRFDERNCHAQSKHDNQWKSGNVVEYRINLIKRIGLAAVEALEADNTIRKWTREELIGIRDTYRQKRKELEKQDVD
jgi:hypothetical protein